MESVVVFLFFCFRHVNYEIKIELSFSIKKQHDTACFTRDFLSCFKMSMFFLENDHVKVLSLSADRYAGTCLKYDQFQYVSLTPLLSGTLPALFWFFQRVAGKR